MTLRRSLAILLLLTGPALAQPQGWTQSEREIFWNGPVGSRLIPYAWFARLEQADREELFATPEHLASFGFLPSPANPLNPDGLPIGFARERDRTDGPWLGMTCAACHVRAITFGTEHAVIDGACASVDAAAFNRNLLAALAATAADDAKFARLADRLATPVPAHPALRDRLAAIATARTRQLSPDALSPDAPGVEAGPGRFDLLGTLGNAVAATALDRPGNARPLDAPVRFPRLWGSSTYDRTLSSGQSNAGLGPLLRNIGQVLATGGTVDLAAPPPYPGSTSVFDLEKIEALLRKLEPPPWPGFLPPIDAARAAQGATVFNQSCASCHVPVARDANGLRVLTLVAPDRPGPADRSVDTAALAGRPAAVVAGPVLGPRAPTEIVNTHVAIGIAAQLPRDRFQAALARFRDAPAPRDARRALPLAGIWAGAPFLHNGSVPNLQQLLTAPADRVAGFSLAPADYDPVAVGLPTAGAAGGPRSDATQPGNASTGHEYGTALPEDAKRNLLEYLKTL